MKIEETITAEEAIIMLEYIKNGSGDWCGSLGEGRTGIALNMGIVALKKQIPKKADTVVSVWGKCPNCGIDTIEAGENYCYQCGQKLDWSDEDD